MQEWLQEPTGNDIFLIPVRRLQRILTDMERAHHGIHVEALNNRITILPHVYVPSDQSVPAMFAERGELFAGRRVLDMGTGTGILALIAAHLGATQVVATDFNPNAVRNARLNADLLGLQDRIVVKGPGDLFAPIQEEKFDLILFNARWIKGEPQSLYDTSLYDPDCRVLDGFLKAAPRHLASGGVILLQYSDISQRQGEDSTTHLESVLEDSGLVARQTHSMKRVSRFLGTAARVFLYEIRRREV